VRAAILARDGLMESAKLADRKLQSPASLEQKKQAALDAIKNGAVAICMAPDVLKNITVDKSHYNNRYKMVDAGLVNAWKEEKYAPRAGADSWVFGAYKDSICFGSVTANSADRYGVDGEVYYGECTVHLVSDIYADRISLFIEDSLRFYERFCDSHNPAKVRPPDHTRANWSDRQALAVVKLEELLNDSHSKADARRLIGGHDAAGSVDRSFIEAHIHGTVTLSDIIAVRLSKPLTTEGDLLAWQRIEEALSQCGQDVRVSVAPRARAKAP
jgi:hypothetical protein